MDFKALREDKLKLTQEEFSRVYGVDLSIVKEWDQTNALGIEVIQRIIEKTGMRFEDIAGFTKPKLKAFDACYTWEKADFTKKSLTSYVNESLKRMDVSADLREKYIEDFQLGVNANLVKPSVSIVGRSDTGKSTLINSLIGMDKMPTSWTPTTSIAVYIKHIKNALILFKKMHGFLLILVMVTLCGILKDYMMRNIAKNGKLLLGKLIY